MCVKGNVLRYPYTLGSMRLYGLRGGGLRIAPRVCLVGQRHRVRETAPSPFFVVPGGADDHRQLP
jgi:hypothetical protein